MIPIPKVGADDTWEPIYPLEPGTLSCAVTLGMASVRCLIEDEFLKITLENGALISASDNTRFKIVINQWKNAPNTKNISTTISTMT